MPEIDILEVRDIENKLVIFETRDGNVQLPVNVKEETVWLNRNQMAELFGRDVKTIGKHINNALNEELVGDMATAANFATVQKEGEREVERRVAYYNLDVIISVGYRVKSTRGVEFRKWANQVLRDYIVKGYAVNNNRMNQLNEIVRIMKRTVNRLDDKQVLSVIEKYSVALDMLDAYDHQNMVRPEGNDTIYVLTYEECRKVIDSMKFTGDSNLFGNEKDDSFKGSIGAIYQTFAGVEVYPFLEEKAANLLYFITKNHSFSDGNKRIAAAIFLYFMDTNQALFRDGEKVIADYTLVALIAKIIFLRYNEIHRQTVCILNKTKGAMEYYCA